MSNTDYLKAPLSIRISLLIAVLLMLAYSFFPIYWMLISGLREYDALYKSTSLIPGPFSLDSYKQLLELTDYPTWFGNSVIVASGTVVITLILAVPISYAVTRLQIRFKSAIVGTMLYAYMFPPLLLAIPLYTIFVKVGIADTLISLIISHLTITLPLSVWLLWGFFRQLPFDVEEAAMVDGCTRLGAFFRVVLPLSRPGIITVAIFSFLLSWTDYTFALVMISSDTLKTLPAGLDSMTSWYELQWGELMAGSTLIALPLLVIFTFLSRYFIHGLASGALKG
jgi:multiple sugar transport system permease protein